MRSFSLVLLFLSKNPTATLAFAAGECSSVSQLSACGWSRRPWGTVVRDDVVRMTTTATTTTATTTRATRTIKRTKRRNSSSSFSLTSLSSSLPLEAPYEEHEVDGPLIRSSHPNDHRYAASDWLQNMKSLPRSTILRAIKGPVLTVMVWAMIISIVHGVLRRTGISHWQNVASNMCISSQPHSFLVSALGLLLVFRTNSAYQKFAEGRQIWERIHSITRNTSRMVSLYENEFGVERRKRFFRLLAAFPYLLHHHIHPQCNAKCQVSEFSLAVPNKGLKRDGDDRVPKPRRPGRDWMPREANNLYNLSYPYTSSKNNKDKIVDRRTSNQHRSGWQHNDDYGDNDSLVADKCNSCGGSSSSSSNGRRAEEEEKGVTTVDLCWVDTRDLPWCLFPSDTQLKQCVRSSNPPLWACDTLAREVVAVSYTPNFTSRERLALLKHIDQLSHCIGECERIHQTAVPLNYARHSLRSLTLWLFTLPFALVDKFGLLTGPVMAFTAWVMFGIYQIGHHIEDPFQGSLRLSILCDAIYNDVIGGAIDLNSNSEYFHHRLSAMATQKDDDDDVTDKNDNFRWTQVDNQQLRGGESSLVPSP